jgi:predicted acyltransferase (DUF342 family)
MWYEIHVSLHGHNFFATHEKSIKHIGRLKSVYKILEEKFPENEGYKLIIKKIDVTVNEINLEQEDKELKEKFRQF